MEYVLTDDPTNDKPLFDETTYASESLAHFEDNTYDSLDKPGGDDGKPGKHSIDFSSRHRFITLGALVTEIGDGISEYPPLLHQGILNHWRERNPEYRDSDLIERVRPSKSPRHAAMTGELQGFMLWRTLTESTEQFQTNFLQADNDNYIEIEEDEPPRLTRDTECELEMRPTPNEIMALVAGVKFETRDDGTLIPAIGNAPELVEYGPEWKPVNGQDMVKAYARIGGLEFATETGSKRYPRSSMTYYESGGCWRRPRERTGTPKGGKAKQERPHTLVESAEDSLYRKQAVNLVQKELSAEEIQVAGIAFVAANLAQVGRECGYADKSQKTQERQGKRLVKAVSKKIQEILARIAA